MINFKQLNTVLLCIFLIFSYAATLSAQRATKTYQSPDSYRVGQVLNGQVVQGQRVIQGQLIQNQPIRGRIIQGQIIQNQPIQGEVFQGQIVPGQVIQGQPFIQGPIIQGRPIRGNVQNLPPQNTQQQSEEQRTAAAANRAKIAEQAARIKAITDENLRLRNVEDTNDKMRKEYARLRTAYGEVGKELDELKLQQAMKTAEPTDNDAQDAKLNQLNAQYQEAVKQSRMLSGRMEALTQENTEIKNRLKNLNLASGNMAGFEDKLKSANSRIIEIEQQNRMLATDNNRRQVLIDATNSDNEQLNMRFSTLSQKSEQLTEANTTLRDHVANLTSQNRDYLASLNARPAAPQPMETNYAAARDDLGIADERDQVLTLNADLVSKNALLIEQVSDLESKFSSLNKATAPQNSLLAVAVPPVTGDAVSKFNIMRWLIPFLLIGLAIGLYVFLMEERGGEVATGFTSARLQSNPDADKP